MFVAMGLSAVFPVVHGLRLFGVAQMERQIGLTWLVLQGVIYVAGAFIYAVSIWTWLCSVWWLTANLTHRHGYLKDGGQVHSTFGEALTRYFMCLSCLQQQVILSVWLRHSTTSTVFADTLTCWHPTFQDQSHSPRSGNPEAEGEHTMTDVCTPKRYWLQHPDKTRNLCCTKAPTSCCTRLGVRA